MARFPYGRMLMSSPEEAYSVKYKINPWMETDDSRKVQPQLAYEQWQSLRNTLCRLGTWVDVIHVPRPDGVFTANAGLAYGSHFILSTFRYEERRPEENHWLEWARNAGGATKLFQTIDILNDVYFEGAGDALFAGKYLVCGYGFRSDKEAANQIKPVIANPVISVELTDPSFYHLDTCFCPLTDDTIMFYPSAFSNPEDISNRFKTIEVPEKDAYRFACNAVVLGKRVILPSGCDETCKLLHQNGFSTHPLDMSEFIKSGGACKCLTLRYF